VATLTCIYLHYRGTSLLDPVGVVHGLLITLNDEERKVLSLVPDGPFKQAGLSGTGGTYQVQCQHILGFKKSPVPFGQQIVPAKHILLDLQLPFMGMSVIMVVCMIVVMMVTIPVMMIMGMLHTIMGVRMVVVLFTWFKYGWFFPCLSASATITHGIPDLFDPGKDNKNCAEDFRMYG
jgi:hypothetical protein